MIFIGMAEGTKGYKFMRLCNNTEFITTTVLFDEGTFPKCPDEDILK